MRNLSNSLCCFVRCLTTTNKTIKQYNIVTTQSNMSRSDLPKNKLQLVSKTHFVFQLTVNLVIAKSQKNFLGIHCIGWCLSRKCIQNLFNPVHYLVILKNTFVSVSPSCEFCESHKQWETFLLWLFFKGFFHRANTGFVWHDLITNTF